MAHPPRPEPLGADQEIAAEPTGVRHSQGDLAANVIASTPVTLIDNYGAPTLAFASSLGRRGVPLHFYGSGAGRWSRFCSRRAACPSLADADRFVPWLRRRIQSGEIQRVAPTSDLVAFYVSMLREDFSPEVRRTIPALIEIERSLIKTRFGAACGRVGQAVPNTEAPDDIAAALRAAQRIGFPMLVKPKSHLVVGDDRGRIVHNTQQLLDAYKPYTVARGHESVAVRYPELLWPMLQKYVPAARTQVYSITGYKDLDGGIVAAALSCKRRQWPPDTGISTWQTSVNDPQLLAAGLRTADQLVSCGIFELELLEGADALLAIDLNPRGFGFMALDTALGNDLPWLWFESTLRPLRTALDLQPRPLLECHLPIPNFISRCVDTFLGPAAKMQPAGPARHSVSMVGDWHDPVPMLLANLRLLRHPGSLVRPYIRAAFAARQMRSRRSL